MENQTQNNQPIQNPTMEHLPPSQPKPDKKLVAVVIAIAVLLIAAVATGAYYWLQSLGSGSQYACTMEAKLCPDGSSVGRTGPNCEFAPCPSASPSATPTSDDISNWQTYRNDEYRFEVNYPQDWTVYYSSGKEAPYYVPLKEQSYFHPNDKDAPLVGIEAIDNSWKQMLSAFNIEHEQYEKILIDSYEAIKKEEVLSDGFTIRIVVNGPQNKVYEIRLYEFSSTKKQSDVDLFNQILSTFKFIDSTSDTLSLNEFNFSDLKVGQKVGEMIVNKISSNDESPASANNFIVDFIGNITIIGNLSLPDGNPEHLGLGPDIEIDNLTQDSLKKLPIAENDTRNSTSTVWFGIRNPDVIAKAGIQTSGTVELTISRYEYIFWPAEVWNIADVANIRKYNN